MSLTAQEWGPGYAASVSGGTIAGQGIVLARAAEFSSEDFQVKYEGSVASLYSEGILGAAIGQTWPTDGVFKFTYTPGGVASPLCLGVATTAGQGTPVSLQPCGFSARVLWIDLAADASGNYQPLINGSDTVTSAPYVLTAGQENSALTTAAMYLQGGTVATAQIWASRYGAYYPSQPSPVPPPRP